MSRARFRSSNTLDDIERSIRAATARLDPRNQRRHGRVKAGSVKCNLGRVLDLSASGLRVRCTRARSGVQPVVLRDGRNGVCVTARVAWTRRRGFRHHETGLEFVNVTAQQAAILRSMAGFG